MDRTRRQRKVVAGLGLLVGAWSAVALALAAAPAVAADRVIVDTSELHQRIAGWEATAWASQESEAFPAFSDELFDRVVSEVGIDRLRLEVRSGAENSRDWWSDFQRGDIEYAAWRAHRYATVNDNDDPAVIDPSGFHFSELTDTVEKVVLPIKARVEAAGERLHVNLNYVAFTSQISPGLEYGHDDPEEYAEFVLAAFLHLQARFGWVPDSLEVLLEPDNVVQWNGALLGRAIVETERRLRARGFTPELIAPSTTDMGNALRYFDALAAVPGALAELDELSYHRYRGVSLANLRAIADRAARNGLRTSMLEWWNDANGYRVLREDLEVGNVSAWQEAVVSGFFDIDERDPAHPVLRLKARTRSTRHITSFVRRGASRVGARSTTSRLAPLAFVNRGGGAVVVVEASAGGAFSIEGLPAGRYGLQYTTATEHALDLPDRVASGTGSLPATIPARGVITVYARPAAAPERFRRADANADGRSDLSDAIFVLEHLFTGGAPPPCEQSADSNDDGEVDVSDAVFLLLFLFSGGAPPPEPRLDCGLDPTPGDLACASFAPCA